MAFPPPLLDVVKPLSVTLPLVLFVFHSAFQQSSSAQLVQVVSHFFYPPHCPKYCNFSNATLPFRFCSVCNSISIDLCFWWSLRNIPSIFLPHHISDNSVLFCKSALLFNPQLHTRITPRPWSSSFLNVYDLVCSCCSNYYCCCHCDCCCARHCYCSLLLLLLPLLLLLLL